VADRVDPAVQPARHTKAVRRSLSSSAFRVSKYKLVDQGRKVSPHIAALEAAAPFPRVR